LPKELDGKKRQSAMKEYRTVIYNIIGASITDASLLTFFGNLRKKYLKIM